MTGSTFPARLLFRPYLALRRLGRTLHRSDIRLSEVDHRREFMRRAFHALAFNGISGDYAEFGSHGATTFTLAYDEIVRWPRKRVLWAFDSFSGLPPQQGPSDYHPGWKPGKMTTSADHFHAMCRKHGIPETAYRTIEGYYHETLTGRPAGDPDLPSDIALAYIDCDLHSSTRTVLEFLEPRYKHGMIVAFDDYFCFSERTLSGERKAMLEHFGDSHRFCLLPYIQFGWHGMSFVLEDRQLVTP